MTILVGLYGLTNNRNAVKLVMSLTIMGSGVVLLFVSIGYIPGGTVPILMGGSSTVDPVPHSFMLTSIVINLATTALGLALVLHLFKEYGTLDVKKFIDRGGDR